MLHNTGGTSDVFAELVEELIKIPVDVVELLAEDFVVLLGVDEPVALVEATRLLVRAVADATQRAKVIRRLLLDERITPCV